MVREGGPSTNFFFLIGYGRQAENFVVDAPAKPGQDESEKYVGAALAPSGRQRQADQERHQQESGTQQPGIDPMLVASEAISLHRKLPTQRFGRS
jgi:hypothetical protein